MIELYVFFSGGKRGQRGGQTGAKKNQAEEHETSSHTVSEEDIATLTHKLEGVSTTFVGGKVCRFFYVRQIITSLINFFARKFNHHILYEKRLRKFLNQEF